MKKIFLLLILSVGIFSFNNAKASHAAGAELLYELVPSTTNTYKFIFKFYRDCTGIGAPASVTMCYRNSCQATSFSQVLPQVAGPLVVSSGCPNFPNSCSNGSNPGYEEYIYEGNVTLNTQCNFWRFWVAISARNPMDWITGGNLYVETTFDNTVTQNDNSPYFSVKPVPYCCINTPFNFNNGAIDVNGDSLDFQSIQPRTGPTSCTSTQLPTNLNQGNGWPPAPAPIQNAATNPIPTNNTFTINNQTGALSFTPTNVGTGVITIICRSYRNGQLIGSVMRDIQVVVLNCSPGLTNNQIDSNSVVNAAVDTAGTINACVGDSIFFCFDVASSDTDAVLVPYSNIALTLPGATITYTNSLTDSLTACVAWQTTALDTGLHVLTVTVIDSSCKPPGILFSNTFSYPIFIDYETFAAGDTTICLGDSTQLQASGGGPFTWSVLPGGSPISSLSCINCDNPTVTPSAPTFYVVEGCSLDTVFVDVITGPTPTITPDTTTCVNANLQLQVLANPPGQTYTYSWAPATYLSSTTIPNPVVQQPQANITYTVTITPQGFAGCQSTADVAVTVLDGFSIAPYDTVLCDGETTTITGAGSNRYAYNWTPPADLSSTNTIPTIISPSVPGGSYTITASFPGCPDSIITIPVIMDPIPVVNAGIDREICLNDTVHLNSTVDPDSINYTIDWSPAADLNSASISNPVFDGVASTLLTVTYTTDNGCVGTDDMTVIVNTVDFLTLNGDRTICPGDTTSMTVAGGVSYYWYPDYYIDNTGNTTTVNLYPDVTTKYYVVGVDFEGCIDTASAVVSIEPGSVVDAGDDVTIYPGETVELNAKGNCSFFNWFPPSGLSSTTLQNPIAQPQVTTKYVVNAQTEFGCPTVDSVTVRVSAESLLDLPNAFSPGSGTSINDRLVIKKRGLVELDNWQIFNRWGEKVFETQDIDDGWDGRYKGEIQPMGAYVYILNARTSTGRKINKQGTITLIR